MKSSLIAQPKKSQARHSIILPLKTLKNIQNTNSKRVTFQNTPQISAYILSNKSISKQALQNHNILPQNTYNQSQKLINEINELKETLKNGRNSRKNLLQEMQKFCEKQNHHVFNSTFTQGIAYRSSGEDATDILLESDLLKKGIIADSFLGSFRAVFTFYIELYFQKMTLALKLKKKYLSIFAYLLKYLNYQFHGYQTLVEIDDLCLAIYRMIKNKNADYKIIDIKYGLKKNGNQKFLWKASDFAQVFQTKEKQSYLSNPSTFLMNMPSDEVVKAFFEVFAQFYDTEIKFKKICKANEKKLTSLLDELSINYELNVKLLAEFLYFQVQKSRNWLIMRFEEFFKDHFGTTDNAINFLAWIKQKK